MGWLAFAGLAAVAAVLLWRLRFVGRLWTFGAAAVTLAAAGYAWQGQPRLAASPARSAALADATDDERIAMRDAMLGRFGAENSYAVASDAMLRAGSPDAAVRALLGGIAKYPDSLALWTELGSTMAVRDRTASPAALFAFRRAASLNPSHPAPPFFLGMAKVKDGEFADAKRAWTLAYELAPKDAPYRRDIAFRLVLLDMLMQQMR